MLSVLVFVESLCMRIQDRVEDGQGLAEYGLILALIAVVAIAGLKTVGNGVLAKLNSVGASL